MNDYLDSLEEPLGVEYANVTIDHMSKQQYRVLREAMVHYREQA